MFTSELISAIRRQRTVFFNTKTPNCKSVLKAEGWLIKAYEGNNKWVKPLSYYRNCPWFTKDPGDGIFQPLPYGKENIDNSWLEIKYTSSFHQAGYTSITNFNSQDFFLVNTSNCRIVFCYVVIL